jgi:hypothetical protein
MEMWNHPYDRRQSYWPAPGWVSMMRNNFGARRKTSVASIHEANSVEAGVKVVIGKASLLHPGGES